MTNISGRGSERKGSSQGDEPGQAEGQRVGPVWLSHEREGHSDTRQNQRGGWDHILSDTQIEEITGRMLDLMRSVVLATGGFRQGNSTM